MSGVGGAGAVAAPVAGAGAVVPEPPAAGAVYCEDELVVVEEFVVESIAFMSPCFEQAATRVPNAIKMSSLRIRDRLV